MALPGFIERWLFRRTCIYVRISASELRVREPWSGKEWRAVPEVAISRAEKPTILAVGTNAAIVAAQSPGEVALVNPFAHPRTLIADWMVAEKLLQHALHVLLAGGWFRPAPVLVMHPLEKLEGGLTQVELRAFRELGSGAGARNVYVWAGRELTDAEVADPGLLSHSDLDDAP